MEREDNSNVPASGEPAVNEVAENGKQQFTEAEKNDYLEFTTNKDNIARAMNLANEIQEIVGRNWFTLRRFCKKSGLQREAAFQKLSLAKTFGFLVHKEEKIKEGGYWQRMTMYKIVISNQSKIEEIDRAIEYYQYQIDQLNVQKQSLADAILKTQPQI